jgi:FkbM family methyltransferase
MIGIEEKEAILKLTPFFNENPVIFDVGSNKGSFTDVMLEEFAEECTLHLFEPTYKLLSFTEIKYEYKKNITYVNEALYRFSGMMDFHYFENENNELSSLFDGGEDWKGLPKKTKPVKLNTVDEYCISKGVGYIDCLKIDCEGVDADVLMGAKNMLAAGRIKFALLEYSPHYKRANNTFKSVLNIASSNGYKVYSYVANNYFEISPDNFVEDYRFENFVITKEEIYNYSVGWNKEFIINTAELSKMDMVLEVGAFEGITTRYICENLLNEDGRVNVVDPLTDEYIEGDTEHPYFRNQYQRFLGNTRGLNLNLYRGKSKVELPKLNALRHDLCYVDGDHTEESVYFDLSWCFAITKVGGYIMADDYEWRKETKAGIDKFLTEFYGSFELVEKGYQVMIRKTTDKYNNLTLQYY